MKRIAQLEKSYMRDDFPQFNSGDTLKVHVKIKEGDKERVQIFQGIVIGSRGSGTNATFTVRKMSNGIGVERVFPAHSPNIEKVELIRSGKVRRAKLYYLRDLTGKSARIREKIIDTPKVVEKKAAKAKADAKVKAEKTEKKSAE